MLPNINKQTPSGARETYQAPPLPLSSARGEAVGILLVSWVRGKVMLLLGETCGRVSFWWSKKNDREMASELESASGVDFRCILHHLSSLTRFTGSRGQLWQERRPKTDQSQNLQFGFRI